MKSLYLQQWAKNVGQKLSLSQGIAPSLGGNRGRIQSERSGRSAEVGAPAQASPHVLIGGITLYKRAEQGRCWLCLSAAPLLCHCFGHLLFFDHFWCL